MRGGVESPKSPSGCARVKVNKATEYNHYKWKTKKQSKTKQVT